MGALHINLDNEKRKSIEVEVTIGGETHTLEYFERTQAQLDRVKELLKQGATVMVAEEEEDRIFFENLKGDRKVIDDIVDYYQRNSLFAGFKKQLTTALGKHLESASRG